MVYITLDDKMGNMACAIFKELDNIEGIDNCLQCKSFESNVSFVLQLHWSKSRVVKQLYFYHNSVWEHGMDKVAINFFKECCIYISKGKGTWNMEIPSF